MPKLSFLLNWVGIMHLTSYPKWPHFGRFWALKKSSRISDPFPRRKWDSGINIFNQEVGNAPFFRFFHLPPLITTPNFRYWKKFPQLMFGQSGWSYTYYCVDFLLLEGNYLFLTWLYIYHSNDGLLTPPPNLLEGHSIYSSFG